MAPPELHWQTLRDPGHDPSLSGEARKLLTSIPPLPLDERRIIAHRWVGFPFLFGGGLVCVREGPQGYCFTKLAVALASPPQQRCWLARRGRQKSHRPSSACKLAKSFPLRAFPSCFIFLCCGAGRCWR